ncbi:hypothetical protein [Neisseria sp. HMSC064E01]|jgi:hypothetical protein|uniref:hypothetical protein n=1 Tax=Neisseria sp. HMSC064E01 TaxID=1715052 RepID=UPI0008A51592|nr:hypothetical protein [Neisseria sp. HMSC064E01]OFN77313.1 hypothetical protein HMPREF2572_09475 [Neisseria sp. HMSC064E01]
MNALDYIDSPLDSISTNNPYIITEVIELTEEHQTKLILIDYLLNNFLNLNNHPYLLGYNLYLKASLSEDKNRISLLEQAKFSFEKATSDSENAMFAKVYLAHVYYDLEEFNHCLDMIEQIPNNYFSKLPSHQNWRDLKIQELKICCLIKLKIFSNFEFILHSYFLKISSSSKHNIPVPTELSNVIKNIK